MVKPQSEALVEELDILSSNGHAHIQCNRKIELEDGRIVQCVDARE